MCDCVVGLKGFPSAFRRKALLDKKDGRLLCFLYFSIQGRRENGGCFLILYPQLGVKDTLRRLLTRPLCLRLMEPDPHIICSPHRYVGRSNPSASLQPKPWFENFPVDASMDKYKKQQQHDLDFRRKRPADEGRRTKMRRENETTESNNNDSSGTNSNSTSSSLLKQPQLNGEGGGRSRGRSPRTGFDPQTEDKPYKTSVRSPNLPPRRPVNEKKVVNWRLACFMSHEYLTRGTLLGKPWQPQDSNPKCRHENNDKSELRSSSVDQEGDASKREKERLYLTLADFLRAGDVHLPGIVNPSQLTAWLGLN